MSRRPGLRLLLALLCLSALSGATASFAQGTCSSGSPARSVHSDLWGGTWRPGDRIGNAGEAQIPDLRDSTDYTGNNLPTAARPLYSSIDIEGDYAFVSYATGFKIFNVAGPNAEMPVQVGAADMHSGSTCMNASFFFVETPGCGEIKEFLWDLDAPPGKHTIFAMAGLYPVGLTIVDTTIKSAPRLLYQDTGKQSDPKGTQVWATTINGRDYAFYGTNSGQTGLFLYDMTSASSLNRCAENTDGATSCAGVYKGRIGPSARVIYVDGLSTASGRHYVVTSAGAEEFGIRIWNVTNPTAPVNVSTATSGKLIPSSVVFGVAMWEQGSQQFLAMHMEGGARIYDVTSCLANGCSALPTPIWTGSWSQYGQDSMGPDRRFTTFSRSGNRPMLYFGAMDQCSSGRQREFIFDASNAASPVEISSDSTMMIDGKTIDYWGWYYSGNFYSGDSGTGALKHGYSRVTPMAAKFNGPNLYRAAKTLFDVHVWTGANPLPPVASFTWSPTLVIYTNMPVTFSDTSTGNPTSRTWTFPGSAGPAPVAAEPPRP